MRWNRKYASLISVKKMLSTREVAKLVGVHPITLERWLAGSKARAPKLLRVGGRVVRLWTSRDIARLKHYKAAHYRKGRGRKRKRKT